MFVDKFPTNLQQILAACSELDLDKLASKPCSILQVTVPEIGTGVKLEFLHRTGDVEKRSAIRNRTDAFVFVLFAIFILHSRESELYRYTLDGKSALAWELPFSRFMGHLSST